LKILSSFGFAYTPTTLVTNQTACLHDQNKSSFLEGRLFSSQPGLFKTFSGCFDWLDKSRPSKKATFVLIM